MQLPKTTLKLNLDSLVAVSFFIALMIPYIGYIGRGYVLPFIIFCIWIFIVVLKDNKILSTLTFRKFELYFLFVFLLFTLYTYFLVTHTTKAFQFTLMPVTYFFIIIMDAYYFRKNPQYKLSIFFFIVLILGIQAAISIPFIFSSGDMVSRLYTSGQLEGGALREVVKNGVGDTSLYANLCGIFFLGIGMLNKYKNIKVRIILIISMIFILVSIIISSYFLPILMLLTGGLIFILRMSWKRIKLTYVFLVLLIFTGLGIFYNSFLVNSPIIQPIADKIQLIKQGNLREDGRTDLAMVSLNTFLSNPFFGVGVPEWGSYKQIGEHMPWLDFLAHYGFFGFLPFLLFLIILFKRNYKFYFKSKKNIYTTCCLIGFLLFIISNFIDPFIFDAPMIIMLIFFYCSMFNWESRPLANA